MIRHYPNLKPNKDSRYRESGQNRKKTKQNISYKAEVGKKKTKYQLQSRGSD